MPDFLPAIRELVARLDSLRAAGMSLSDKDLAAAVGVRPSTVSGWRKAVADTGRKRLVINRDTADAIASLADPRSLRAFEAAVQRFRETMESMEAAVALRRALLATSAEDDADAAADGDGPEGGEGLDGLGGSGA